MNKRQFIQNASIQFLDPGAPDVDKAIAWAERLWLRLSERGYGAAKTPEQRETRDAYRDLTDRQREWFDAFWDAFGHKHGRARAAMRWEQLGELDDAEYRQIIAAAKAERRRHENSTQTRKMAEGWLAEGRWRDAGPKPKPAAPQDDTARQRRELKAELKHMRELREASGNDALDTTIERLEERLKQTGNTS